MTGDRAHGGLGRGVNLLLGLVMVGFVAVQYNDPDGPLWALYYLVPAGWSLAAALRPALLRPAAASALLWACVVAWAALVVVYWPPSPGFWRQQVWMNEETAREGMGLMVALAALLVVRATRPGTR